MRKFIFFGPTPTESRPFRDVVTAENIYRERILAVLVIAACLALMVVDYGVAVLGNSAGRQVYLVAIASRIFFCAFLVSFLFGTTGRREWTASRSCFWDTAMVLVSLAWVGAFSGALLVVRPGVEPYLMGVLVVGSFLFHDVARSMLFFAVGYFAFLFSVLTFRPEFPVLLSSVVMVTLATLVAFVISRIVFRMRLESYRDAREIAGQRKIMQESVRRLQRLSYLDPLTGIANRRYLEATLSREWRMEARSGQPLSVIMVDIDWFKLFNDTYGHIPGDECLRQVALCLEAAVRRPSDQVGRYGGEEFCIILPITDREGAICTAKHIMQGIHDLAITHESSPFGRLTVSMGIATREPHHSSHYDRLVHAADSALYHAKISGRNRIAWCCPVSMEPSSDAEGINTSCHMSLAFDCPANFDMEHQSGTS